MKRLFNLALVGLAIAACAATVLPATLELHTRSRAPQAGQPDACQVIENTVAWAPEKTAIIICDMWDRHWCAGATARVAEMAPRMNAVLEAARQRGVRIIHAPSDTMKFYADSPQRRRMQEIPATAAPEGVGAWRSLNRAKEGPLPIDDSDGGCDDLPQCRQGGPWRSQIATLEIRPEDFISDSGAEIFSLLQQEGIDNVIVMGVHTNMCVLGRPFSIRALVGLGKNVVLMRDLTDTMYNSRRRPWVSHFVGTDLVVEHIERSWCPSITSADFLGGTPFKFAADRRARLVFVIGENEYRTWETVPAFARQVLAWRGYRLDFVTASTRLDDFDFQNDAAISDADLVFVSVRRRAVPAAMMRRLQQHLEAGKPLVGIRTASHAFAPGGDVLQARPDLATWPAFDVEVLAGNYRGHHAEGPVTEVVPAPGAAQDPILTGLFATPFQSRSSLYRNAPLRASARPLLVGTIPGEPGQPVAWTHTYGTRQSRVFYTSLGGPDDFRRPAFRRLLLNGILWALDEPLPPAEADPDRP